MSIVSIAGNVRGAAIGRHRRLFAMLLVLVAMVAMTAVSFAQATPIPPPTIALDITPLFDSMNSYIPIFLVIFAIPGGIVIAIALVRMLINAIGNAIKSAGGSK